MKQKLKTIPLLKYLVVIARVFIIKPNFLKRASALTVFLNDYRKYKKLEKNDVYRLQTTDLFPRIYDKTTHTDVDPVYYLQGCWCAKKIFENKPTHHYDIASQALMVGIISQFVPTTMIDIRPLSVTLPELSFIKGDITHLPFKNGEVSSVSSICVIEHIGLGRYGDPLDQFGTEKSAKELERVLAKNGNLYVSVPVDSVNKTYFNAHRAFTREHVLSVQKPTSQRRKIHLWKRNISII